MAVTTGLKRICSSSISEEDDPVSVSDSMSTTLTKRCNEGGSNESISSIQTECESNSSFNDVGTLVHAAHGSLDHLKLLTRDIPDAQRMQYLAFHSKPSSKDTLQLHSVTKSGNMECKVPAEVA